MVLKNSDARDTGGQVSDWHVSSRTVVGRKVEDAPRNEQIQDLTPTPGVHPGSVGWESLMIRSCTESDVEAIFEIINDGAQAYKGSVPDDLWHEPYMPMGELRDEMERGVRFFGLERDGQLLGVMGLQDRGDVDLIRHAYVRTRAQRTRVGTRLLQHLESSSERPILVGTWAAASWAISFYERNGYTRVPKEEADRLLKTYWTIPERQVETSVVLANEAWWQARRLDVTHLL